MSVTICYPTPGASVPGGGGMFAWGTITSDDRIGDGVARWTSGGTPFTVYGPPADVTPAPCNWAFRFFNVGVGPNVTLTISAASGDYTVSFTCLGH
jgi:hypothetical protein